MKVLAYERTILVPIAVPWIYLKIFSPKTFSLSTKSNRALVCSCGSGRLSFSIMALLAFVPSSWGMFRYRLETSMVTSKASCGTWVFFSSVISSLLLLRSHGMLRRVGLMKWSR